jgi:MFS superfamily sulfate permease-like transporter
MNLATLALIVLIVLLIGALPTWPYSNGWGYYPSSGLGLVVVILIVLLLLGKL